LKDGPCCAMSIELEAMIPFLTSDRRLDGELKQLIAHIRAENWSIGDVNRT
jgi:hypothetical protein